MIYAHDVWKYDCSTFLEQVHRSGMFYTSLPAAQEEDEGGCRFSRGRCVSAASPPPEDHNDDHDDDDHDDHDDHDDDDDDDDSGIDIHGQDDMWNTGPSMAMEIEEVEEVMPDFDAQFEKVWPAYVKYVYSINWQKEFPAELGEPPKKTKNSEVTQTKKVSLDSLLEVNIGKLFKKIQGNEKYGFLPDMARASRGNVGALGAESFCERVISAANIVMTKGNKLLANEELDMLVVLRMNRDFMDWAREKFSHVLKADFKPDMIPIEANDENSDEEPL